MGKFEQPLPPDLRALLDGYHVRAVVEYVADRLEQAVGERTMTFRMTNGDLRESRFGHEPVRNAELEAIGSQ